MSIEGLMSTQNLMSAQGLMDCICVNIKPVPFNERFVFFPGAESLFVFSPAAVEGKGARCSLLDDCEKGTENISRSDQNRHFQISDRSV